MPDRKERLGDEKTTASTKSCASPTVASTLAAMLLEQNVRAGREVEIPSLGISTANENRRERRGLYRKQVAAAP